MYDLIPTILGAKDCFEADRLIEIVLAPGKLHRLRKVQNFVHC